MKVAKGVMKVAHNQAKKKGAKKATAAPAVKIPKPAMKLAKAAPAAPKGTKVYLPFPGKPSKPKQAMTFKGYNIYTDLDKGAWRVKMHGVRTDRSCSFKTDAKAGWEKVLKVLQHGY